MDSFEWNKIFGAVLGTALFVVVLYIGIDGLMEPEKAAKPGMEVVVAEEHGTPGEPPVAEVAPDWGTVLPAADLAAGENIHKRCQQCHDFIDGGPNKIGPNLYNIVGAKHAQKPGFAYSTAMQALADKPWGYDELDQFIKNPKAVMPGTKMSFAGISKQQDRVNLIAYMRTLSPSPFAIPAPKPAAPPAAPEATPAEGAVTEPAGELQAPAPGTTPAPGTAPATITPPPATPPAPANSGH
jgi:cytochrome c